MDFPTFLAFLLCGALGLVVLLLLAAAALHCLTAAGYICLWMLQAAAWLSGCKRRL